MRRLPYLTLAILSVIGVAYLTWLNPQPAELWLSRDWRLQAPLAAELTAAFLAGAFTVLLATARRSSGLALHRLQRRRQEMRAARLEALIAEGKRLLWAGDPERARRVLARAWRQSADPRALLLLVESCLAADRPEDALRILQGAGGDAAEDPEILRLQARIARRVGDTAAAITSLERLRGKFPRFTPVLRELRDLYMEAERWQEVAAVQKSLAELDARRSPAQEAILVGAQYAAALAIPGREARRRALEELVSRSPHFLPGVVSLGDELVAAGRRDDATRLWEHALRQRPRTVLVERLAALARDRTERERLRGLLKKARGRNADENAVRLWLAQLWLEDGDAEAAERELEAVAPPARSSIAFQRSHARLRELRGQHELAAQAYRAAADSVPHYRCAVCLRGAEHWQPFCSTCRRWDTFRAQVEIERETPT